MRPTWDLKLFLICSLQCCSPDLIKLHFCILNVCLGQHINKLPELCSEVKSVPPAVEENVSWYCVRGRVTVTRKRLKSAQKTKAEYGSAEFTPSCSFLYMLSTWMNEELGLSFHMLFSHPSSAVRSLSRTKSESSWRKWSRAVTWSHQTVLSL